MKKNVILVIISIALVLGVYFIFIKSNYKKLPIPEVTEGIRGEQFGIDKNINEKTIDKYLDRSDSVYIDLRMLKDPGNYEAIGGDSYLSGFIKGFIVVPLPLLVNVENLPTEVGKTYDGKTLYTLVNNKYTANYKESLEILEYYFPKDKNIFLMCGGGGYAALAKNMLISLGWDKNKIYNIGGYWYYEGDNNINVKKINEGNEISYNFWKVTYHDIDFNNLHEAEK